MKSKPSTAAENARDGSSAPNVSVVIPTLNEASRLSALIERVRAQDAAAEIVVADGGSMDGTYDLARRLGVRALRATAGRGRQLERGAAATRGGILLFLHADSDLPPGALDRVRETLAANPDIVGGNFRLLFDGGDGFSRWLNGFYAWIRKRGLYYGDSAVFVRRDIYDSLGGIRPIALMEDYDFVRRLERAGRTCCIEDPPLVTSARRFRGRHPARIVAGWLVIHILFHLGVSPDRLARLYDSSRRREKKTQEPSRTALSDQS